MLIVILIAAIAMFAVASKLTYDYDTEVAGCLMQAISIILFIVAMIGICASLTIIINGRTIDAKIDIHTEENAKIEMQIAESINQYQEYEMNIISEVSPESAMQLITVYPELKADELVKSQINVYIENNNKIKDLKVSKINIPTAKWWLYFGK